MAAKLAKIKGVVQRHLLATAGVGVALFLAAVGVYAYRFFTERPGEDALRFIPATAPVVVTLDLSPSASQAAVFKKIDDALARNGLDRQYGDLVSRLASELGLEPDFADCLERAGAFAVFDFKFKENEAPSLAFIVGLKNPKRVEEILRNFGSKFFVGAQTAYALDKDQPLLAVAGSHLLIATNKKTLVQAIDVFEGKTTSIRANPDFVKARADLDADSNLMAFVNVRAIAESQIRGSEAQDTVKAFGWAVLGVSLRDGGIAFKSGVDYDLDKVPALARLAAVRPLESDLYSMLPSGAYMVAAGSEGSAGLESMRDILSGMDEKNFNLRTFDRDIRKEIGMGIDDGVLPAFKGDSVLALYPSQGASTGVELLLVISDRNGANPAKLADAVRRSISTKYASSTRRGPLMQALKGDGSRWQMDPEAEQEMRKAFTENPPETFDIEQLVNNKTVTYAKVGNAVLIATSKGLLDRALASYTTRNDPLTGDPSIMPALREVLPDAQSVMVLDLSRLATCMDALMRYDKMDPEAANATRSFMDTLKRLTVPMHGSSSVAKNRIQASFFMPMDYDGLIDFIGGMVQGATDKQAP